MLATPQAQSRAATPRIDFAFYCYTMFIRSVTTSYNLRLEGLRGSPNVDQAQRNTTLQLVEPAPAGATEHLS